MVSMNKVFLGGNLTRDPELRHTPSGMAVSDLRLAVNQVYVDKNGQKQEEATFVDVVVWGKQAETVCQYLKKGSGLLVEGALQFDSWEHEGQKRSRIRVKASRIQFLSSPGGKNTSQSMSEQAPEENFSAPTSEDIPF